MREGASDEAVAGSRERGPSRAYGESSRPRCVSKRGIPRDPRRDGEDPRSRVRRSKPDAVSRIVALGRREPQGVPFSGGISPNAFVMRGGLGDAGPEGVEIVDYH